MQSKKICSNDYIGSAAAAAQQLQRGGETPNREEEKHPQRATITPITSITPSKEKNDIVHVCDEVVMLQAFVAYVNERAEQLQKERPNLTNHTRLQELKWQWDTNSVQDKLAYLSVYQHIFSVSRPSTVQMKKEDKCDTEALDLLFWPFDMTIKNKSKNEYQKYISDMMWSLPSIEDLQRQSSIRHHEHVDAIMKDICALIKSEIALNGDMYVFVEICSNQTPAMRTIISHLEEHNKQQPRTFRIRADGGLHYTVYWGLCPPESNPNLD